MDPILNTIQTHAANLVSAGGLAALANILLIDLVMSGDNAIMIGMAVRPLHGRTRRLAIVVGIALATVLRITLACFATLLISVTGLQLAGGLLLLYVVWKFYRELRVPKDAQEHPAGHEQRSLGAAVWTILLADVSMSLDNVLAVAGASHGNLVALGLGLLVSVALMALASSLVAGYLDRFPWLQWAGLLAILFVAADMLLSGSARLSERLGGFNVLPAVTIVAAVVFSILHTRTIHTATEEKLKAWMASHYRSALALAVLALVLWGVFGGPLNRWLLSHRPALFVIVTLLLGGLLELITMCHASPKKQAASKRTETGGPGAAGGQR